MGLWLGICEEDRYGGVDSMCCGETQEVTKRIQEPVSPVINRITQFSQVTNTRQTRCHQTEIGF